MASGDLVPSGVGRAASSGEGEAASGSSCFHEKRLCTAGAASFSRRMALLSAGLRRRSETEAERRQRSADKQATSADGAQTQVSRHTDDFN